MNTILPSAEADIEQIFDFIRGDSPKAGLSYVRSIREDFKRLSPRFLSRRASESLPQAVRIGFVPGFKGYTYHYVSIDEKIFMLSAFAPGLSDETKDRLTRASLNDLS